MITIIADEILRLAEQFFKRAIRTKGKSLIDTGYKHENVDIYRAVPASVIHFKPMDYVTRSKKWAIGHAEHGAAVDEESYHVIRIMTPASNVFEAGNPGEYFYDGPEKRGSIVAVCRSE
jgi:hypothetical protein